MRTLSVLPLAVIAAVALAACTKDPYEAGKTLGDRHAELVRQKAIDFEQIAKDVEEARAPFAEAADTKEKFDDGYREGVRPVRAELAAMAMEAAGVAAGQAIGDVMEGFGEGLGRAVTGFVRGITGGDKPRAADGDHSGEAPSKDQMKALGRDLGKVMKKVSDGMEAVADGLEEELEKSE